MPKTIKKIWNIVSAVLVALMVLCAVFLVGIRVLGYQMFTVISGSMEPQYSIGDLIAVKEVDPATIEVGDPITFILNEDLVVATHRVIAVDAANQHLFTKGDANTVADSEPVHFNNVIGVPQFSIPLLGYVSNFVQHPPGNHIALVVGMLLIVAVFVPDIVRAVRKSDEEVEDEDEQS